MRTELFDFDLPPELVALRPAVPRDAARLLVVRPRGGLEHRQIRDLPGLLRQGDIMLVNDSRVIPARLNGTRPARSPASAPVFLELTLLKRISPDRYSAFAQPARRLQEGDQVDFQDGFRAHVVARSGPEVILAFNRSGPDLDIAISGCGNMPLPPYIAKLRAPDEQDHSDYQTAYADQPGSVAAPTAGLHFTPDLIASLAQAGIPMVRTTLHVGAGTFLPVSAEDTDGHRMHAETALLDAGTAARLNAAREAGGRVVAVGTTVLRTLESAATPDGLVNPFAGDTDIFITPGYRFRAVDVLLTNFHLPRSTLFMLVSAFMGLDVMQNAYAEAIRQRYRFYSYGDACLLFRLA